MEKHHSTIVFIYLFSYCIVAYCSSTLSEVVAVSNTDALSPQPGTPAAQTVVELLCSNGYMD